ncbi:hypothetical protein BC629DRAFT_1285692 [Irpex lacteus]|nr:hypothetical protein BC629DRAFT_1285692 [Irpex lacteus]
MAEAPENFTVGSLYIAGFAQARAPHIGLLVPIDVDSGWLVHIRIDRATSPTWAYQCRRQPIKGDMFLTSLIKVSKGSVTPEQLREAASAVVPPNNDEFGECASWVWRVLERLHDGGLIRLDDVEGIKEEVSTFVAGNRAFARRDKFPNVMISQFCS